MTFDPQHDYEDTQSVKARFNGGLQQPIPCPCHVCRMFELTEGPMLVPAMQTMPDGRRRYTGRWLHGVELRRHLAARRQMIDGFREVIAGHALVER